MSTNSLFSNVQNRHIASLDLDSCRETLRLASEEAIEALVPYLSSSQYEYAKQTLPPKKSAQLENAWQLHQSKALKI